MTTAFQQSGFQQTPLAFQIEAIGAPVYPDPADVRLGITYGPTGADYVGTMVPSTGSGSMILMRRR